MSVPSSNSATENPSWFDDILVLRTRDLLESVDTAHVIEFGTHSGCLFVWSTSRVVCGSGFDSAGANTGSNSTNALNMT
jgi:hypothetical protein